MKTQTEERERGEKEGEIHDCGISKALSETEGEGPTTHGNT
jgi:hypothetical protein